jgi:hypothetical protein
MAHIHPIIDSEPHFIIDTVTRQIINKEKKKRLIQHDHDSERFTFELPREVDGHLMTEVTSCKIHYINIDKYDKEIVSKSFFEVTDLQVEGESVIFSWLISGVATKYYGTLNFIIEFECVLDGEVNYVWQTDIYKGFPVMESFSNSEYVFEEYYDVIEQWGQKIFAKLGKVKTVNGIKPDENGNVSFDSLSESDREKIDNLPYNFDVGVPVEQNNAATVAMFNMSGDEVDSFIFVGGDGVNISAGENNEVKIKVNITQEAGNDKTAIMSQEAVTEEVGKVEKKIPKDLSELTNDAGYIKGYTETDPTVPQWAKQPTKPKYTAEEVGALPVGWEPEIEDLGFEPLGTAENKVSAHNISESAHNDIRDLIPNTVEEHNANTQAHSDIRKSIGSKISEHNVSAEAHNDIRIALENLVTQVKNFLDVDDATKDQLSELIALIEANADSIETITNGKVNVADIVANLYTEDSKKPLSASMGVTLYNFIKEVETRIEQHAGHSSIHVTQTDKQNWNNKADKATTLAGYGITDAAKKATTLAGYGITDAAKKEEVPTSLSQLTDDVGYVKRVDAYDIDVCDTLIWNGDRTGRITCELSNEEEYVHVSYDTPTLEDFANGWDFEMSRMPEGVDKTSYQRDLKELDNGVIGQTLNSVFYVVPEDNTFAANKIFPKKGIYFRDNIFQHITTKSLTITGYTFTEMKSLYQYLPKHTHSWDDLGEIKHPAGTDVVTSDDFAYGGFHKVCDVVPTATIVKRGGEIQYYVNGVLNTADFKSGGEWSINEGEEGMYIMYGGVAVVVIAFVANPSFGTLSFSGISDKGIYFLQTDNILVHSMSFKGFRGGTTIETVPLPNKYLGIIEKVDFDTLVWDGDTEGLYKAYYKEDTEPHYLITDSVPSIELLENSKLTCSDGSVITEGAVVDMFGDENIYQVFQHVIVAYSDYYKMYQDAETNAYVTVRFKKGVYFKNDGTNHVTSFKIDNFTGFGVEKVKARYLPENIGGGGVSSWNDLTDKPFYEITIGEDVLTWDGNKNGLPNITGMFYYASSVVPTAEDLHNGGTLICNGVVTETFTSSNMDIVETTDTMLIVRVGGSPRFVIATCDNAVDGAGSTIANKGVYLLHDGAKYVSSLEINGFSFKETKIKTIDPKFLPPMESGVSSWNDLTDRPFGETTTYGDTLTWDGNTEGLEFVDLFEVAGAVYYKISNAIPTVDDLANGVSVGMSLGNVNTYPAGEFIPISDGVLSTDAMEFFIVDESAVGVDIEGIIFPESGVYVMFMADEGDAVGVYVTSLTINNYNGFECTETVPLPNKYLDFIETVGGDTLTWDGDTSGLTAFGTFCKVSDSAVSTDDLQNGGTAVFNTMTIQFTSEDIVPLADNLNGVMHPTGMPIIFFALADNIDMGDGDFIPEKGIYFAQFEAEGYTSSLTINGYTGFTKEQVKEEYLPSGGMVVDLGSPTLTDGAYEIEGVNFTPFYEHYIKGNNVVFKISGSDYVNYASLIFANVADGIFMGQVCDTTGIVMVIFTTP